MNTSYHVELIASDADPELIIDAVFGSIFYHLLTRHVANEVQLLSMLSTAEQEKLNALLRKLMPGSSADRSAAGVGSRRTDAGLAVVLAQYSAEAWSSREHRNDETLYGKF